MKKTAFPFDTIVVTAANEAQARGYRAQLASAEGRLARRVLAVADPGDRRVGSLLSTVNVLKKVDCTRGRVLICHSGGDSKRLPAYAALGKAFVPVPQPDGRLKPLFEVIVGNMARIKLPPRGVLVVCGDVAPTFDFAACGFSNPGVTGVACRDSMDEGSRHGVYVAKDAKGVSPVTGFLQKPTEAVARSVGALVRGKVLVDTGILWIDASTCVKMAKAYAPCLRKKDALDIYERFTADLMNGFAPFSVNVVPKCDFFHIGSTAELLAKLGGGAEWVEGCALDRSEMKLGGHNVVTFVPREYGPIELGDGECLTCLPIGARKWVPIRYRLTDDFKSDGKWEAFGLSGLMPKVNHDRLLALRDEARVDLPLRIDFAGGWSDTPPICNDLGGTVLNAAVELEGTRPVHATVRRVPAREVRIESSDLGKSCVIRDIREIRAKKDPHDWCALVKSALTVVGYDFAEGGLDIRISARVPKGSGLGTSSILSAALLRALVRVLGRGVAARTVASVSALTLALEREMQTGGGWQDQLGGLAPGIKLIRSRPGSEQSPAFETLRPSAERAFAKFLESRALLYFTGRKRMARNVLRGVLKFYAENPDDIARQIVLRLKDGARQMFAALERSDFDAFARLLNEYWMSKKALDPGSTNPEVESIIAKMAPWISAVSLCGAGGGGFMFVIASDAKAKARIRDVLTRHPPVRGGRFYDFALVPSEGGAK